LDKIGGSWISRTDSSSSNFDDCQFFELGTSLRGEYDLFSTRRRSADRCAGSAPVLGLVKHENRRPVIGRQAVLQALLSFRTEKGRGRKPAATEDGR